MKNIKRILAIIVVIIFVGMYILTFVMSFIDKTASLSLFKGCVATTIFVPIVAYSYICLHKYAMARSGRKNYYDTSAKDADSSQADNISSDADDSSANA